MFGIRKKRPEKWRRADHGGMQITYAAGDSKIGIGNAQHKGQRDYQEDSFGISEMSSGIISEKGILAVLADGMGGLTNGKAVSETIVNDLLTWFNDPDVICCEGRDIVSEISAINNRICDIYCNDGSVRSGSTVVAALIKNSRLHWACVGDSRIYIIREGRAYRVNEDHDFLNRLLDDAIVSGSGFEKAFSDPQKDSLVGCIGMRGLDRYDYSKSGLILEDGDKIILCSDGVYNAISDVELSALSEAEPMAAAEAIKNRVLKKQFMGQDNLTVIVISIEKQRGEKNEKNI